MFILISFFCWRNTLVLIDYLNIRRIHLDSGHNPLAIQSPEILPETLLVITLWATSVVWQVNQKFSWYSLKFHFQCKPLELAILWLLTSKFNPLMTWGSGEGTHHLINCNAFCGRDLGEALVINTRKKNMLWFSGWLWPGHLRDWRSFFFKIQINNMWQHATEAKLLRIWQPFVQLRVVRGNSHTLNWLEGVTTNTSN